MVLALAIGISTLLNAAPADTAVRLPTPPVPVPVPVSVAEALAPSPLMAPPTAAADTVVRPRAVEHSDAYYERLRIHRLASWAIYPLFVAEYPLGQKLMGTGDVPSWVRPAHGAVAGAISGVFAVNTVTGLWNLWDSRHDSEGRTRRWLHAATMLASDAGFVATGLTAQRARHTTSGANLHRGLAVGSMALSAASSAMMLLWRN